jgi:hypothetical protein
MVRCLLICFFLLAPGLASANDRLQALEQTACQGLNLQPGLERYSARIVSVQVADMLHELTAETPAPPAPSLIMYRQCGKPGLVTTLNEPADPVGQQIADHFAKILSSVLERTLIPEGRSELRRRIADRADIKTADTLLGQTLLKRIELTFETPVALQEAFYTRDLPLPQESIAKLYFDIEDGTRTIQEVGLLTADGLKLTMEMRYHQVPGGFMPERIKITSQDGRIDDLLEITYKEIGGFSLPASITQIMRRPGQQENLAATLEDHQINQPFPENIRRRFELQQ